jgi:hypothetical protein
MLPNVQDFQKQHWKQQKKQCAQMTKGLTLVGQDVPNCAAIVMV